MKALIYASIILLCSSAFAGKDTRRMALDIEHLKHRHIKDNLQLHRQVQQLIEKQALMFEIIEKLQELHK